ncbi:hypothetical protein QYF36_001610 [Acer negundo]|nr:hypothetical protein QYF36_001610 [Acer negundo]
MTPPSFKYDVFLSFRDSYKYSLDKVQRWKDALKEASNLSGFDSSFTRCESEIIQEIVEDILKKLNDREIIRQESIENPGKLSRLWHHEDIYHVLTKNTGTEKIEGISLDMSNTRDIHLGRHAFVNMRRLRFLKFFSSRYEEDINKVHNFPGLETNFTELSNVEQLWSGIQYLSTLWKQEYYDKEWDMMPRACICYPGMIQSFEGILRFLSMIFYQFLYPGSQWRTQVSHKPREIVTNYTIGLLLLVLGLGLAALIENGEAID